MGTRTPNYCGTRIHFEAGSILAGVTRNKRCSADQRRAALYERLRGLPRRTQQAIRGRSRKLSANSAISWQRHAILTAASLLGCETWNSHDGDVGLWTLLLGTRLVVYCGVPVPDPKFASIRTN